MIIYGYARVSTIGQTLAAQEATLHEAGAAKVFKEKISGAANHRAQLHRLLKTIDAGDLVIVTRLDRLARSTRDLLNILDTIAKAGADIQITRRRLGRHDHGPRTTDADGSWWPRGIRTRINSCADWRGSRSRQSARRPYGTTVQAEPTSATRSDCATRGGGSANGYRQDVWSASHYDRPIAGPGQRHLQCQPLGCKVKADRPAVPLARNAGEWHLRNHRRTCRRRKNQRVLTLAREHI